MWYNEEWTPRIITFYSTHDINDIQTIAPSLDSLVNWKFQDILYTNSLPDNPFYNDTPTHECSIRDLKEYLKEYYQKKNLITSQALGAMACYMYLQRIFPHVWFVGKSSNLVARNYSDVLEG